MGRLSRIWNPAEYQGGSVSRRYFEGWYFKQVDAAERDIVALIPGVSYSADGSKSHSFVQLISTVGEAHYFMLPAEEFEALPAAGGKDPTSVRGASFGIRVGRCTFSDTGMSLDLADPPSGDAPGRTLKGEIGFGRWSPWPVSTFSPGIMGWYRFVPRMETYHGVLSMDHEVTGWLEIDGRRITLDGGRGYVEKDWGHSFPSSWIWAQTNHFGPMGSPRPSTSLSVSVAKVPWMTGSFVGHIAGLLLDGELHRFTTYTGAKLTSIETGHNEAHLTLADKREEIELHIRGCAAAILKAPVLGEMEGKDAESLGGTIDVELRALRGGRAEIVFADTGRLAAIEVMNDADELG